MSYFKEIELELPKDPNEQPKPKIMRFDKPAVEAAVDTILKEFELIRTGKSDLTTYAIDPGRFGFPAMSGLTQFQKNPTKDNLMGFIGVTKQTLGNKAAQAWILLLAKTIIEENTDE